MSTINQLSLRASLQRALLYNIIPAVRVISVDVDNESNLFINVCCDRELNQEEKDIYFSVGGEVAGDFPEIKNTDVNFSFLPVESGECLVFPLVVYARYEQP